MAYPPVLHSSSVTDVSQTCETHGLTEAQFGELRRRSVAAKATAYCPYSNFHVGAAVLTIGEGEDAYVAGANVENASYPVGSCAEVTVFSKAVTEGFREFRALAVASDISPPASPCGKCRQL